MTVHVSQQPLKKMQRYTLNDDVTLKIVSHLDLSSILSFSRVSALVAILLGL